MYFRKISQFIWVPSQYHLLILFGPFPSNQLIFHSICVRRAEKNIKHCRIRVDGRLYTVGCSQFESLVELINYYERHSLYKKIKLTYPVNESIVQRNFQVSKQNISFFQSRYSYFILVSCFMSHLFKTASTYVFISLYLPSVFHYLSVNTVGFLLSGLMGKDLVW